MSADNFNREFWTQYPVWLEMERAKLWTQAQHLAMVKAMPPIRIYPDVHGHGGVVAHHVRTAANSGTGIKPSDFYTIPIYQSHHAYLHQHETRRERQKHLALAKYITRNAMHRAWINRDKSAELLDMTA